MLKQISLAVAGAAVWLGGRPAVAAETVDFNRDVRPIFLAHCTACHGGVKAAGGLSLVYREKALAKGKSGEAAVVPGKPEASEMIRRITSDDPDELMPKPDHGPRLAAKDVSTLKAWIAQGATWSEHWSFVPPTEPAAPAVADRAWARSRADEFILARLQAEGLKPSPPASNAEWLRRASLDLIGLPPTLAEYESFRDDATNDLTGAKSRVVDRLLVSPAFGERWASVWLDLARYADTFGYEKDPHRDIWPWRDWVIRAFNSDMPFDQFTIKQLAGDLLENPTTDDLLATAFHRNTQNNTEGGTNDEEFRTVAVIDRVSTTWTTWQATTFGCVQCHSHPYDPIPHQDFYRFSAFFDNSEDCDIDSDFPRLLVPTDATRRDESARLQRRIDQLRDALNESGRSLADQTSDWKPLVPTSAKASAGTLEIRPGTGRVEATGTLPIGVMYTVIAPSVPGATALRIKILPDDEDPKKWPERAAVLSQLQVSLIAGGDAKPKPIKLREVIADYLAGPFDPQETLDAGAGGFGGYPSLSGPRWCVVTLDEPLPDGPADATVELVMKQNAVANAGAQACPIRRFELSTTADPRWPALMADGGRRQQWADLNAAKAQLNKIAGTRVPVMVERHAAARRDTRVFLRGNRLTKDVSVEPGIPDVVRPPVKAGRLTRLDLAQWLVSDQNPLTARVLANRLWAEMYGRGIVETLEDFGTSGARPSHPELLDHLALRLAHDDHWSIKTFLREVALSATYGQTCRATPESTQRDPQNALLSHGPRARLTAEMVRDQGLALSGLLSFKQFGPPVFPKQPDGVWRSVYSGAAWKTSEGEDAHRRGLYTYWKRTAGYPTFMTFDSPARDVCTARRVSTNTPLQALVTLNDPAFVEMSQALARRMREGGGDDRAIVARGCQLLTLEQPPEAMVAELTRLYQDASRDYAADPADASKLAKTPEEAATVLVANTLLNLDRAMTR